MATRKDYVTDIAKELKILRIEQGLTMRELREQSGVSTKSIVAIEAGKQKPSALTLGKLAKGLRVPVRHLLDL